MNKTMAFHCSLFLGIARSLQILTMMVYQRWLLLFLISLTLSESILVLFFFFLSNFNYVLLCFLYCDNCVIGTHSFTNRLLAMHLFYCHSVYASWFTTSLLFMKANHHLMGMKLRRHIAFVKI